MPQEPDYYSILGVIPSADDIVIRAAFRVLVQRYHPDKWRGDKTDGDSRIREINVAYEILSNKDRRREYDRTDMGPNFHPAMNRVPG
jgi:curved DNA-binding protein CbpA